MVCDRSEERSMTNELTTKWSEWVEEFRRDEGRIKKVVKRTPPTRNSYAKVSAIRNAVDYEQGAAFAIFLHREGHRDLAADPDLWELVLEAQELLTGEELVEFLRRAPVPEWTYGPLPGWPVVLDELVMRVFLRDPDPLRDVTGLSREYQEGVRLVRARCGDEVEVGDPSSLAERFARTYFVDQRIGERVFWPTEDGVEEVDLDLFRLVELFTTRELFAKEVLALALEEAEETVSRVYFPRARAAIEIASEEQMVRLLEGVALTSFTETEVERALLEWRNDDPQTLRRMALAVDDTGLRKFPVVIAAMHRLLEAGEEVDGDLVDALHLSFSPSLSWISQEIYKLPEDHRSDLAAIDEAVSFGQPGYAFRRTGRLFPTVERLSPEHHRRLIDRLLESRYEKERAIPFFYLVDDEDLWRQGVEVMLAAEHEQDTAFYGVTHLPLKALPLLAEGKERAASEKKAKFFQRSIVGLMAAALDRGEVPGTEWDDEVSFDLVEEEFNYHKVRPLLGKVIHRLPGPRAEAILRREIDELTTFGRAFAFLGSHPSPDLLEFAFHKLVENEGKIRNVDQKEIEAGLRGLPSAKEWAERARAAGSGPILEEIFGSVRL